MAVDVATCVFSCGAGTFLDFLVYVLLVVEVEVEMEVGSYCQRNDGRTV